VTIVTSLQLTDASRVVPPARAAPSGLTLVQIHDPAVNERLYTTIGRPLRWTDRLPWTADRWAAHADSVQTHVAGFGGQTAGYYELHEQDGAVQIAIFGLLEHARGLGLGGHLLVHALRQGFLLAPRVWVHTCTDDGPHALANYQARGLRVFDVRPERLAPAGDLT